MQINHYRPSPLARLDRQLAQGEVPHDLETIVKRDSGLDRFASTDLVASRPGIWRSLKADVRGHAQERSRYLTWMRADSLCQAVLFGAVGVAAYGLFTHGPVWGSAVAFGLGALVGAATASKQCAAAKTGQVKILVDGQTSSRQPYYSHPNSYKRTPQELRSLLMAVGALGDEITPGAQPSLTPNPTASASWNASADRLAELDSARRLVADLGHQSRYGKPTLSLVDPHVAVEVLASGGRVAAVRVESVADRAHSYQAHAESGDGSRIQLEDHHYTTRSISYRLDPIREPDDLTRLAEGEGLPPGFCGVYADGSPCELQVRNEETHTSRVRTPDRQSDGYLHGRLTVN
ncbi:MAG: hypothetical protein AB7S38_11255 [Vulcanimicrobiota bacterium]